MKYKLLPALALAVSLVTSQAATVTVNTADNADFTAGKTNLVYALTNITDGDTIAFSIPGAGPHYLQTPVGGYPLLIKDRVTIDGYSQAGAVANSNPITTSNNSQLKIVLDSRNGNYRDMEYTLFTPGNSSPPIDNSSMANERGGYGNPERAVLGIYRATNVNIRGIVFLGTFEESAYGIAVAHDYGLDTTVKDRLAYNEGSSRNCHINGCWFGIDPTNQTVAGLAPFQDGIAFFRHRDISGGTRPELPSESLIVGVKPGSANPRAEFNVFAYMLYCLAGEGIRTRFSGNFAGVFPDGVTPTGTPIQFSAGFENGRYDDTVPNVVGTDGDGVNDAEEGNLFGPLEAGGVVLGFYSTGNKPYIVAGNRFGIAVDGSRWTNSQVIFDDVGSATRLQFGSDFNGVSDAAEANIVYNNYPFSTVFPTPANSVPPDLIVAQAGARVSVRGNVLVNNGLVPYMYANANIISPRLQAFTNYCAPYMSTNGEVIPSLSASSTAADIIGVCATTNGSIYTNIIIDVYVSDPEGWTNGMAFNMPELFGTNGMPQGRAYLGSFLDNGPADRDPAVARFNFGAGALGLTGGTDITITANYSADPVGTTAGRTHTSNFSNPATLRTPVRITAVSRTGTTLNISWSGGTGPYTLQKASPITGAWSNVTTGIAGTSTTATITGAEGYFRVLGN